MLPHDPGGHRVFKQGPLARAAAIIRQYYGADHGLAWLAAQPFNWALRRDRRAFRDEVDEHLGERFRAEMVADASRTSDLPRAYCQAMAAEIRTSGEATDPPLYLFVRYDLARAGLFMRLPFLGFYFRRVLTHGRPCCAWCGQPEGQWGHHLLRCPRAPDHVNAMRDVVLHAIYADVDPRSHALDDGPLSDANLDRLYRLD